MKTLIAILFLLILSCSYHRLITQAKDMTFDPCFRIISQRSVDAGLKEVFYKDTCDKE